VRALDRARSAFLNQITFSGTLVIGYHCLITLGGNGAASPFGNLAALAGELP